MEQEQEFTSAAAEIVSAFVSRNAVSAAELPLLIQQTIAALASPDSQTEPEVASEPLRPAVPVKKSVSPDRITCLEDGKTFQSLKRHLRTAHDLTPQQYRTKWGLPNDYPVTAPNYSEKRSGLARQLGLGQKQANRKDAD